MRSKNQYSLILRMFFMCILAYNSIVSVSAQVVEKTFEELHDGSSDIILAEIQNVQSFWNEDHTRIYSTVDIKAKEKYKGNLKKDEIVIYTHLGGAIDGIISSVSILPVLTKGDECILFLKKQGQHISVTGYMQGSFSIERKDNDANVYRKNMGSSLKRSAKEEKIKLGKKEGIKLKKFVELIKSHKK